MAGNDTGRKEQTMKKLINKFMSQKIRNTIIVLVAFIAADAATLTVALGYYERYGLAGLFMAVALSATAAVVLLKERDPWEELLEDED